MIESAVQFGPEQALIGVLTQPDGQTDVPEVAYLLFNAGVIPRIGTHRLNVKIARALGSRGEVTMRFDLSGQGDSRHVGGGGDFRAQAIRDLRAAMDHLEQTLGVRRFALIGVCSGAVNAYWTSLADARVSGLLMVDGFWYRSRWTRWVRHWKRFRAIPWSHVVAAVKRRLPGFGTAHKHQPDAADGLFAEDSALANPPREEFALAMGSLVARRTAVFLLYGGSVIDFYSYRGQFRDAFAGEPWLESVRCDYRPEIDHTFVSLEVQQNMIDLVLGWMPEVSKACRRLP